MKWPAGAPIEILDIPLIKTLTDASAAMAAITRWKNPRCDFREFPSVIVIRGGLPGNGPTPADVERACTEGPRPVNGSWSSTADAYAPRAFRAA
jgi:hypothetical protein